MLCLNTFGDLVIDAFSILTWVTPHRIPFTNGSGIGRWQKLFVIALSDPANTAALDIHTSSAVLSANRRCGLRHHFRDGRAWMTGARRPSTDSVSSGKVRLTGALGGSGGENR
jgi:hypothetical protein